MILLDENIVEDQRLLLRSWHIAARQIGLDVARSGIQDDELIPLLHSLKTPTLFTRDLRFYSRDEPHAGYCIVALAVGQGEVASYVRRFLKHQEFDTNAKRMGKIVYLTHNSLRVRQLRQADETPVAW